MTTVVLARKYRPRNFAQMAGQPHVVKALTNALQRQRLHHAYLFTGTRGIGKTTVSRILAKSLNCTGEDGRSGVTPTPCGQCAACRDIDADRFVDYIELDAASNRSIDEIRDLIERAAYKPAVGRYKVFMIDEAHQLTKDAFNALLKTLEEPPEYLKFILATTDPERMLPTVLSRCLQFNLRPMPPEVVQEHLLKVLEAENILFDESALVLLAHAARGSMRDALSLTDQAIAHGAGQVREASVREMLGVAGPAMALDLTRQLLTHDLGSALRSCSALREQGVSPLSILEQLIALLQQVALAQAGEASETPAASLAELADAQELQLLYSILLHGKTELALCADDALGLVMLVLRFFGLAAPQSLAAARHNPSAPLRRSELASLSVTAAPAVPVQTSEVKGVRTMSEPSTPLGGAAAAAVTLPTATARVSSSPSESSGSSDSSLAASSPAGALASKWEQAVRDLVDRSKVSGLLKEAAWQSQLVGIDNTADGTAAQWTLAVEHESLRATSLCERLEALLREATGQTLVLRMIAADAGDSPARREARLKERMQAEAEEAVRNDPLIGDLMAQFPGARLVPGSVRPA